MMEETDEERLISLCLFTFFISSTLYKSVLHITAFLSDEGIWWAFICTYDIFGVAYVLLAVSIEKEKCGFLSFGQWANFAKHSLRWRLLNFSILYHLSSIVRLKFLTCIDSEAHILLLLFFVFFSPELMGWQELMMMMLKIRNSK